MKIAKVCVIVLVLFLVHVVASHAGGKAKIGVVDFQKVLQKSKSGRDAQNQIQAQGEALKVELQKKQDEIKEMQEKYKRESVILSDEQKVQKERELRTELNAYRVLQNQNTQKFNQIRSELVNKVRKAVMDLAQDIGKSKGYTLIIEKQSGTVLYAKDPLYITDQFASGIDKQMQ